MLLYATLGLCAFLAALLVYRYDLYERERWYMVVFAIVLGAVAMRLTGALELRTLVLVQSTVAMAGLAALHEETARLVVVLLIAVVFPRHFNDPMDGIIYGSMVGLGMALEESVYLLGLVETPQLVLLPVETVRLLGHLVMGGIVGFGIGLGRFDILGWRRKLALCLVVSFLLHFFWDWISLDAESAVSLSVVQTGLAIALMLFGIGFYGSLVVAGSQLSKAMFAPDSREQLWGWPFTVLFDKSPQPERRGGGAPRGIE